jgi:hypothetical protein
MGNISSNNKPKLLWLLIVLYFFNALGTAIMYFRTLAVSSPSSFDPLTLRAYAVADFPFSIIPGFIVAFGLFKLRSWGWVLGLMLNAVYFHSMTVLLVENLLKCKGSPLSQPMIPISACFLLFAAASTMYLIASRGLFLKRKFD